MHALIIWLKHLIIINFVIHWHLYDLKGIHIQLANGTATNEVHLIIQKDEGRQSEAVKTNRLSGTYVRS